MLADTKSPDRGLTSREIHQDTNGSVKTASSSSSSSSSRPRPRPCSTLGGTTMLTSSCSSPSPKPPPQESKAKALSKHRSVCARSAASEILTRRRSSLLLPGRGNPCPEVFVKGVSLDSLHTVYSARRIGGKEHKIKLILYRTYPMYIFSAHHSPLKRFPTQSSTEIASSRTEHANLVVNALSGSYQSAEGMQMALIRAVSAVEGQEISCRTRLEIKGDPICRYLKQPQVLQVPRMSIA